jgi:pyruvate/2-oxoglutarate/acetoin dehydrogenase E1 component/TPP-dependent pyruvate/acetoin dehydrogenase alpha subunit
MSEPQTEYFTSTQIIISKQEVLADYRLALESRFVSLLGRKDVFMGRGKFGIFGDGKELPQIALSKVFRKGDFRSGYYRDQTLMVAIDGLTWQQFFAQLYAHADIKHDVSTGGRSMNAHFGNHWVDENGRWLEQTQLYNSVVDVSSTAGQMPRSIGLAYASKLFRNNPALQNFSQFSNFGNEVCFATIGDASTSQGMFFEAINAAGVLQIPLVVSVWDDGYGISVPIDYQTTKGSISAALEGFARTDNQGKGIEIIKVKGWDYVSLIEAYQKAARIARDEHVPVLVHVVELTQPQGHSASGSHERYKSHERLAWEHAHDCNDRFHDWIIENGFASEKELLSIKLEAENAAKNARKAAWDALRSAINGENNEVLAVLNKVIEKSEAKPEWMELKRIFENLNSLQRKDGIKVLRKLTRLVADAELRKPILKLLDTLLAKNRDRYSSHLYSQFPSSPMLVKSVPAKYSASSPIIDGRGVINAYFDLIFANNPLVFALGEDVGKIGDVNQGFAGLQEKYGEIRITDTGIRETTIIGQGIGAAMRGLRPIVEIQYFDYIYYALATLTDDLASLRYRTVGKQLAPLIVRTRGHRLEGIWHSGSPMGVMLHALRGMHVIVPRNFVKAAGFYNTLLKGDDPALVIECLNGYRIKEKMPDNLSEICEPLGVPEILREGNDITLVTYGSMCRIVMEAAKELEAVGIDIEVIDVQTLLPFDINHLILESIKKTNRVIFADEDMPGGGAAYMMQQVLDLHDAYHYLDAKPVAISAEAHRPAYGTDGDYFSKPNVDNIFDAAYQLMREAFPQKFRDLY